MAAVVKSKLYLGNIFFYLYTWKTDRSSPQTITAKVKVFELLNPNT